MDASASSLISGSPENLRPSPTRHAGGWDRLWLVFCMAASSVWCITAAPRLGPTFDEPNYVANGLERWRTGSYGPLMRQGTMPLPVDVCTWPLHVWEKVRGESFRIGLDEAKHPVVLDDLPRLLSVARWGTLPFWCLLLLYAWRIGRSAGPWGGRVAVTLTACEPNLLAHATLATTDIAATACLLMLTWHFVAGRSEHWSRRVLIPGVLFGVALLAKASALVFWPLCWCGIEFHRLWVARRVDGQPKPCFSAAELRGTIRDGWQIGLIGLAVTFLYVGTEFRPERSFVAWSHSLPDGALSRCMMFAADNLRIFPNAGEGLVFQIKHNIRGHGAYILGATDHRALWYYFPLALGIKLSLASLLLLPAVASLCPRALRHWALAAAAVLLLFSVTYRVQIGIRLVLPIIALLAIGSGAAASIALRSVESLRRRRLCAGLALTAVAWGGFTSVSAWPHALAYTNELFRGDWQGGPALCDSNIDWGQGLVELNDWRQAHGLPGIDVWFFGTDPAVNSPPFHPAPLHRIEAQNLEDVATHLQGNHLAVSTTLLYGPVLSLQQQQAAQLLRELRPVGRTTTFFIFDLGPRAPEATIADHESPAARR